VLHGSFHTRQLPADGMFLLFLFLFPSSLCGISRVAYGLVIWHWELVTARRARGEAMGICDGLDNF